MSTTSFIKCRLICLCLEQAMRSAVVNLPASSLPLQLCCSHTPYDTITRSILHTQPLRFHHHHHHHNTADGTSHDTSGVPHSQSPILPISCASWHLYTSQPPHCGDNPPTHRTATKPLSTMPTAPPAAAAGATALTAPAAAAPPASPCCPGASAARHTHAWLSPCPPVGPALHRSHTPCPHTPP
jgi:hypothetical protein